MGLSPAGFGARFWVLIVATFLGFLGEGTVLPALGPHIRHDLGGSDRTIGLAIGLFSFVSLASRFLSGPLADRKGRKIAFMAGMASCTVAGLVCLLPWGVPGIYLARSLQGLGEACLYTGAAAWAVEVAGIDRCSQALGYVSCGIWGGTAAGPMVGAWLGTFERAAGMQVATAVLGFLLLARVAEEYKPSEKPARKSWFSRKLLASGLSIGFVNVHSPVVAGFLILHLAKHGNSGPAAYSAYALVILLSRFFLGGLPDRIRPGITYYGGLVAMAIGLVVLSTGPAPAMAVSAGAVLGLGLSFPWSSVASTVVRGAAPEERGSALGILTAFFDLFVGASSLVAGVVASKYGYSAAFLMAALALVAAAISGKFVFSRTGGSTPAVQPDLPHRSRNLLVCIPSTTSEGDE